MDETSSNNNPSLLYSKKRGARVAYLGNSIQYFNDTPRFMIRLSRQAVVNNANPKEPYDAFIEHQNSCFRGGANLGRLWREGNGMLNHGFASKTAIMKVTDDGDNIIYDVGSPTVEDLLALKDWDFIVMNDHTQGPARLESRNAAREILMEKYAPLIAANQAISIIIETVAYRFEEINGSRDLGTVYEFQQKVREGVLSYVDALRTKLPPFISPRIAPVGAAYLHVHEHNFVLWEQLFDSYDSFHPSPKGTFLQGCVLHYSMFLSPPQIPSTEEGIADLWKDARMMNWVGKKQGYEIMPLPTVEEAKYLLQVSIFVCDRELNKYDAEPCTES
ncbi:hypothetical protein HJC23_008813 [Cyclotella cryptica]|uniref:Uncharacterized protein n=1 Tax=Cyclotella cryptica TaxID=29204 RepID=A0ABD3QFF9_9STRA|eukprot:CCRYP_007459-RA/>CCRYP_007459-RA protein AED:0.00 eAED:0.00 QI:75/-1/1/1/-1/1/1/1068/331